MYTALELLLLFLLVRWAIIARRFRKIDRRLDELSTRLSVQPLEEGDRGLEQRVAQLESLVWKGSATPADRPAMTVATPPVRPETAPPRAPFPAEIPAEVVPDRGDNVRAAPPAPARVATVPTAEPRGPSPLARWGLRERFAGEEWEAVVGGSWLNKLGVLVLVIGLGLFLGYSLLHLGPLGRIAVGLAVSGAMLVAGVGLEPGARYLIFARGLIGGGWAALYFTTYAMHGLDAARVISNPLLGMSVLAVVAIGLILHSLRYRSEVVTGLAYGVGFITLAISPVSVFSLIASVPLGASLLFVAQRFSWVSMPVAGLVLTYGVFALRSGTGPPTGSLLDSFAGRQSILAIYWLLFECFGLLDVAKRRERVPSVQTIFPLNACGFVGVSLLQWSELAPTSLDLFFAAAGGAYLASTIIRARIRPPSSFRISANTVTRALAGGYEGAVTLAVALMTPAAFLRFSGLRLNVALLLEAEFLFLAGLRLGQPYLRALAAVIFAFPVAKLVVVDVSAGGSMSSLGMTVERWTPVALLTAAVLYVDRAAIQRNGGAGLLAWELPYSYTAPALLALALYFETPVAYVGLTWLVLALPLFEVGLRRRLSEFRAQSYGVATLGAGSLLVVNVFGLVGAPASAPWVALVPATVVTYAAAARLARLSAADLGDRERVALRDLSSAAGTALGAGLLWHILPTPLVALGWGVQSLLLTELGFAVPLPALRLQGALVGALVFGRMFLANFTNPGQTLGISHRILTVVPLIVLFYYVWAKLRAEETRGALVAWEQRVSRLYLYAPAVLGILLIRFELGRALAVVGWAFAGLALLLVGLRWENQDLRWQSYGLAVLTFARSWGTNFYIPESFAGVSGRIVTGATVIANFYAAQLLSPRPRADLAATTDRSRLRRELVWVDLRARAIFCVLATALFTLLLLYEVSGRLLTVAWGLEGVVLLVAGFPLRDRIFRLSGLALLGLCILKVFAYDFRELDALARILSFVGLGVLLLGASLMYTRFRDRIRRYL